MRKFLIACLVIQILLICVGVWQLTTDKIGAGLFNVIVNTYGILLNIYISKQLKNK
jgi:hypothetical protein